MGLGWAITAILTSGASVSLTFLFIRELAGEDHRGFEDSAGSVPPIHLQKETPCWQGEWQAGGAWGGQKMELGAGGGRQLALTRIGKERTLSFALTLILFRALCSI